MPPEEKLSKAFELSELSKNLFIHGLRKQNPELSDKDFHDLLLRRLKLCHNRNY
jgi:hypothetical protein